MQLSGKDWKATLSQDDNRKASAMCKTFYEDVTKFTNLNLFAFAQKFLLIQLHIDAIEKAEHHKRPQVAVVHSAENGAYLMS